MLLFLPHQTEVPGVVPSLQVKEVWSRSASIVWSQPITGNTPIEKYTLQYWRHERVSEKSVSHRLNELDVPSTQTSALIKDLSPGMSYQVTLVAHNQVGRGEPAKSVTFNTGEEEPSAPPSDVEGELNRRIYTSSL